MPRTCSVCGRPEREAIDAALLAGAPLRNIAEKYGLSVTAVHRHKSGHILAAMAEAKDAADVASADSLLGQVRDLQAKTLKLLAKAEKAGDLRTAVSAIGQARGNLELLGKLAGQLQAPAVNILIMPEWTVARATLWVALAPYPEARAAAAAALLAIEAGHADN